jgi:hypothetical protein
LELKRLVFPAVKRCPERLFFLKSGQFRAAAVGWFFQPLGQAHGSHRGKVKT